MAERKKSEDVTIRLSRALQQGDSAMFTRELLALVKVRGVTARWQSEPVSVAIHFIGMQQATARCWKLPSR